MASVLSNHLGNQVLSDHLVAPATYLALHTDDPTALGDPATEVAGGDYARQEVGWAAPGSRTTANTAALTFPGMPAVSVTHWAVWDAPSGGNMLVRSPLPEPVAVPASGHFLVAAGDLAITV